MSQNLGFLVYTGLQIFTVQVYKGLHVKKHTKFSITECAKLTGLSRTTLYKKYINSGALSVIREGCTISVELSELLRIFPDIKINDDSKFTTSCKPEHVKFTTVDTQNTHILTRENELLREQLRQAQERESWFKSQIDELREMQGHLLEDKSHKKKRKIFGIF